VNVRFSRHLLYATLLLLAALAFIGYRNWDTIQVMIDNASALNEGGTEASSIRSPDDLLTYLSNHPDVVSLAVMTAGSNAATADAGSVFVNADVPRAVTALPKLLVAAEYHRRVAAGEARPDRRVPLDSVAVFSLPGVTAENHRRAVDSLRAQGLLRAASRPETETGTDVSTDTTVALRHLVGAALQMGDEAAMDWILHDWGAEAVRAMPQRWGLSRSSAPQPATGTYLVWNHTRLQSPTAQHLEAVRGLSRDSLFARAFAFIRRLARDAEFRAAERRRLSEEGSGLTLRQQRDFAVATYPVATARDYAQLLAATARGASPGKFGSASAGDSLAARLQEAFERPVRADTLAAPFTHIASKSGAYPGLLSFAGYARRSGDRPPRVVVMLLEDVPLAVLYHLLQTGIDKGFQLQLLGDDAYLERVQRAMRDES
jgi:hypothetical protein